MAIEKAIKMLEEEYERAKKMDFVKKAACLCLVPSMEKGRQLNGGTDMTVRERPIKLLSSYFQIGDSYAYNLTRDKTAFDVGTMSLEDFEEFDENTVADIADHLLKHGVIVPPCKVGDTVYYLGGIRNSLVKSSTVEEIIANSNGVSDLLVNSENGVTFENSIDIFYFTREEAEDALAEANKKTKQ